MATTSIVPNTVHADGNAAAAALVNKAVETGYTGAQVAALGEKGLIHSIVANLLDAGTIRIYTVTFDPASAAAVQAREQDVTVTGVLSTDLCLKVEPAAALTNDLTITGGRVKAADTIAVTFCNPSAGAIDNASVSLRFVVLRFA